MLNARTIPARLLTTLLVVVLAVFPTLASGAPQHCGDHEDVAACCETADDACECCAGRESTSEEEKDSDSSCPSGCTKCMHSSCRTTAEVVRNRTTLPLDQDVIVPVVLPAESMHDPVTCDAIFHPPRA